MKQIINSIYCKSSLTIRGGTVMLNSVIQKTQPEQKIFSLEYFHIPLIKFIKIIGKWKVCENLHGPPLLLGMIKIPEAIGLHPTLSRMEQVWGLKI